MSGYICRSLHWSFQGRTRTAIWKINLMSYRRIAQTSRPSLFTRAKEWKQPKTVLHLRQLLKVKYCCFLLRCQPPPGAVLAPSSLLGEHFSLSCWRAIIQSSRFSLQLLFSSRILLWSELAEALVHVRIGEPPNIINRLIVCRTHPIPSGSAFQQHRFIWQLRVIF